MKILFDQGAPVPLRRHLHPHNVDTAAERGWHDLKNGELLARAESESYDLLVTTDQNLKYQQNLKTRKIRVLVLMTTSWPRLARHPNKIREKLESMDPGEYSEINIA